VKKYAPYRHIQVHGSGRSKVLIGDDYADDWARSTSISSCSRSRPTAAAAASTPPPSSSAATADALADALARKLAAIEPLPRTTPMPCSAASPTPRWPRASTNASTSCSATPGAEDVTARYRQGPRLVERYGQTFLQPTLDCCDDLEHPLANTEFMFPFASVLASAAGPHDRHHRRIARRVRLHRRPRLDAELMTSTNIERLNIGPYPTNRVQWEQPHEGNLFEFLYRRRALQGDLAAVHLRPGFPARARGLVCARRVEAGCFWSVILACSRRGTPSGRCACWPMPDCRRRSLPPRRRIRPSPMPPPVRTRHGRARLIV
jgi:hypothetical protein